MESIDSSIKSQSAKGMSSATWTQTTDDDSGESLAFLEGYRDCVVSELKDKDFYVVHTIKKIHNMQKPYYFLDIGIGW